MLFDELPLMPELDSLDLYDNVITNIADLARFPKLKTLDLSFNCLQSLEGIEAAPGLNELFASNNFISDFTPLASLKELRILELGHNKIMVTCCAYTLELGNLANCWSNEIERAMVRLQQD